jgi:flagellar biosynthesis/type III secretory pathway M-ring protein FliF/YscJ
MEFNDLLTILCWIIPVLIIAGIVLLLILFFIIRGIIRRTKRKLPFQQGSGDFIRRQLINLDQATGAAPRDNRNSTLQPTYRAPTSEPELDLSKAEQPVRKSAPPDETSTPTACPACGAPRRIGERKCAFCGRAF